MKRKRCQWCERLVHSDEIQNGLCEECYAEYCELDMIVRSNS